MTFNPKATPLSAYIHWPWCVQKCPYCDFNSHASLPQEARYVQALLREWKERVLPLSDGRPIETVFFGGGTPSLMTPESVATILEALRQDWGAKADWEVTLEVNPGAQDNAKLKAFRDAGVTRLSIGVQSFHPGQLKTLGRIHSVDEAFEAIEVATGAFPEVNVDVMFGLPNQTIPDLALELSTLLSFPITHASLYQLTIEEGTRFGKHPPQGLPDEDLSADLTDFLEDTMIKAGFEHYEVSAWARPGHRCRHNQNYWQFGDYLALGAGAHSKWSTSTEILRQARPTSPERYMTMLECGAPFEVTPVRQDEVLFEFMLNALRLTGPLEFAWAQDRAGYDREALLPYLMPWVARGAMTIQEGVFEVTSLGQRLLTDIQASFLSLH